MAAQLQQRKENGAVPVGVTGNPEWVTERKGNDQRSRRTHASRDFGQQ